MARSRTGGGRDQYPLFQLWRPSGTDEYERVYESRSDGGKFTASEESGITIGEYVPYDPDNLEVWRLLAEPVSSL